MQGPGSLGVVATISIISGGPGTGLFEYQGAPGPGNSPILWATAPGTTIDPSGNTLEVSGGLAVARRSSNVVQEAIWLDPNSGSLKLGASFDGSNYTMGTITVFNSQPYTLALISPSDRPSPATHFATVQLQMISGTNAATSPGTFLFNNEGTGYTPISASLIELGMASPANNIDALSVTQFADTVARYNLDGNGKMRWGPGNAALDSDLYRAGINFLETDGQFLVQGNLQTFTAVQAIVSAGTTPAIQIGSLLAANQRWFADGNGKMWWGAGGGTAVDTDLYRLTTNILATDAVFALGSQAGGLPASQAGFGYLICDQFTQLRTDRAFVSMVNFEAANQGSPPGTGGSGAKYYSTSGHMQSRSGQTGIGGDTLSYDVERLTLWLTADTASLSNTVAANIPGLPTKTVQAQTYHIKGVIFVNQGAAAGTITVAFAGPATSAGGQGAFVIDQNPTTRVNQTGGLGSQNVGMTNIGRTSWFEFDGVVTFSAAGTLSVQASTSAAIDPYTVKAGSYIEIEPVVAT